MDVTRAVQINTIGGCVRPNSSMNVIMSLKLFTIQGL